MKNHEAKNSDWEKKIAIMYISQSLVRKEYAKVLNDYPQAQRQEIIGRLLNSVFDSFIEEDLVTVVKVNKNITLNFNILKSECNQLVKEYVPELFERNWQRVQ